MCDSAIVPDATVRAVFCDAQPAVWASIRQRLAPGGRVMCNLGHPPGMVGAHPSHVGRTIAALDALAEAFQGV